MDPALANIGWTEDQWNRICSTVVEEAQKARIAAQLLPCVGPEDKSTVAIPSFRVNTVGRSLVTNSDPDLFITRIAVNVELRSHEVADPQLGAAIQMFRRAANAIARVEDALAFYGRRSSAIAPLARSVPNYIARGLPGIYTITQDTHNVEGIFQWQAGPTFEGEGRPRLGRNRFVKPVPGAAFRAGLRSSGGSLGDGVVNAIISAITAIEQNGYFGPFACALSSSLFEAICTPSPSLVLPRDRILPFLQGPLLRASALRADDGVVISLAGNPVELVVASEVDVRFLQNTVGARALFRVSERVAIRIKDPGAIQAIKS